MNDERDFTIARSVARASNLDTRDIRPKHIRLVGVAFILGALMCFLFTVNDINWSRGLYPKLVLLIPSLVSMGVWHIADARALSSGRRRYQKVILGVCLAISFILTVVVCEVLAH